MAAGAILVGEHETGSVPHQSVPERKGQGRVVDSREELRVGELDQPALRVRVADRAANDRGDRPRSERLAEDAPRAHHAARIAMETPDPRFQHAEHRLRRSTRSTIGAPANELLEEERVAL